MPTEQYEYYYTMSDKELINANVKLNKLSFFGTIKGKLRSKQTKSGK